MLAGALTASVPHFLFKTLLGFKLALNQGRHREKRLSKYMAHRYIDVSMYLYIFVSCLCMYIRMCVCVYIHRRSYVCRRVCFNVFYVCNTCVSIFMSYSCIYLNITCLHVYNKIHQRKTQFPGAPPRVHSHKNINNK